MRENHDGHEFDLLSGNAGAIVALLAIKDILDDTSILDYAVRLGEALLETASRHADSCSWNALAFPRQRHLTGFSHGTAGAGYALLELFHATGDSQWRSAAELAFGYERRWFDAEAGNWPDFRETAGWDKRKKPLKVFATTWCHGAPGIALSRLRAYEILGDETCRAEAMTALETTRAMIWKWLQSGNFNYSLCHGLAGNADVLLLGSRMMEQQAGDDAALARDVGWFGIKTFAQRGHQWPCGAGGGQAPGLMTGVAGIGHFYLRLQNPATTSLLMLRCESPPRERVTVPG